MPIDEEYESTDAGNQVTSAADLVEQMAGLAIAEKASGVPLMVAITGIDTAGKTRMPLAVQAAILRRGSDCQVVHVDDFHRPRAQRYDDRLAAFEQYYRLSIDFEKLAEHVLEPIRRDGRLQQDCTLLDLSTDIFSATRRYDVDGETVVLVEGVFLLRKVMAQFFDLAIYLHVDEAEVIVVARD